MFMFFREMFGQRASIWGSYGTVFTMFMFFREMFGQRASIWGSYGIIMPVWMGMCMILLNGPNVRYSIISV